MIKCWSAQLLEVLPHNDHLVFIKDSDDGCHPAILVSVNEDGTVTVIESNKEYKQKV